MFSRSVRQPKTPVRAPHYPYRANPLWPSQARGEWGELQLDALSGAHFPKIYTFNGPYGPVDVRNGGVVDVDQGQHELVVNMIGPPRPPRV